MLKLPQPFFGDTPALSYQDILKQDSRPSPDILRPQPRNLGTAPVPAWRYTSAEFFRIEVEKVWLKTWQFACLIEAEIFLPGDTYLFELLDKSLMIVRQQDGGIKAFRNVCRHRGRQLINAGGCKREFRCPYHGFTWNTDGRFTENRLAWDFPQVDRTDFGLLEVRVECWEGFVFVNFDPDAEPLLTLMAPMPEHFSRWRIDECYKSAHVGKIIPANWKVCVEAFIESHHVISTHPQYDAFTRHDYSQLDVLSDHVTRFITPTAVSPACYAEPMDDARRFEIMMAANARDSQSGKEAKAVVLPLGVSTRAQVARMSRHRLSEQLGHDLDAVSDAEIIDGIAYDFFPNFHLWGGFKDKICYRFRPWGMNHEQTLLETMLFSITPKHQMKPPPAKLRMLRGDQRWSEAVELGALAGVYDQDESNMGPVQDGLHTLGQGSVEFGNYLEVRCRNLHRMIDEYLAR